MDNSGRKSLLNSHTNPHIDQEEMGNVG